MYIIQDTNPRPVRRYTGYGRENLLTAITVDSVGMEEYDIHVDGHERQSFFDLAGMPNLLDKPMHLQGDFSKVMVETIRSKHPRKETDLTLYERIQAVWELADRPSMLSIPGRSFALHKVDDKWQWLLLAVPFNNILGEVSKAGTYVETDKAEDYDNLASFVRDLGTHHKHKGLYWRIWAVNKGQDFDTSKGRFVRLKDGNWKFLLLPLPKPRDPSREVLVEKCNVAAFTNHGTMSVMLEMLREAETKVRSARAEEMREKVMLHLTMLGKGTCGTVDTALAEVLSSWAGRYGLQSDAFTDVLNHAWENRRQFSHWLAQLEADEHKRRRAEICDLIKSQLRSTGGHPMPLPNDDAHYRAEVLRKWRDKNDLVTELTLPLLGHAWEHREEFKAWLKTEYPSLHHVHARNLVAHHLKAADKEGVLVDDVLDQYKKSLGNDFAEATTWGMLDYVTACKGSFMHWLRAEYPTKTYKSFQAKLKALHERLKKSPSRAKLEADGWCVKGNIPEIGCWSATREDWTGLISKVGENYFWESNHHIDSFLAELDRDKEIGQVRERIAAHLKSMGRESTVSDVDTVLCKYGEYCNAYIRKPSESTLDHTNSYQEEFTKWLETAYPALGASMLDLAAQRLKTSFEALRENMAETQVAALYEKVSTIFLSSHLGNIGVMRVVAKDHADRDYYVVRKLHHNGTWDCDLFMVSKTGFIALEDDLDGACRRLGVKSWKRAPKDQQDIHQQRADLTGDSRERAKMLNFASRYGSAKTISELLGDHMLSPATIDRMKAGVERFRLTVDNTRDADQRQTFFKMYPTLREQTWDELYTQLKNASPLPWPQPTKSLADLMHDCQLRKGYWVGHGLAGSWVFPWVEDTTDKTNTPPRSISAEMEEMFKNQYPNCDLVVEVSGDSAKVIHLKTRPASDLPRESTVEVRQARPSLLDGLVIPTSESKGTRGWQVDEDGCRATAVKGSPAHNTLETAWWRLSCRRRNKEGCWTVDGLPNTNVSLIMPDGEGACNSILMLRHPDYTYTLYCPNSIGHALNVLGISLPPKPTKKDSLSDIVSAMPAMLAAVKERVMKEIDHTQRIPAFFGYLACIQDDFAESKGFEITTSADGKSLHVRELKRDPRNRLLVWLKGFAISLNGYEGKRINAKGDLLSFDEAVKWMKFDATPDLMDEQREWYAKKRSAK